MLKIRHTPEKLDRIIEAVKRFDDPQLWITDIYDLNRIYRKAKAFLIQPDAIHRELLQAAIEEAEGDEAEDLARAGYLPGSVVDPRD